MSEQEREEIALEQAQALAELWTTISLLGKQIAELTAERNALMERNEDLSREIAKVKRVNMQDHVRELLKECERAMKAAQGCAVDTDDPELVTWFYRLQGKLQLALGIIAELDESEEDEHGIK